MNEPESRNLNIRIGKKDAELGSRLDRICESSGKTPTDLVKMSLNALFDYADAGGDLSGRICVCCAERKEAMNGLDEIAQQAELDLTSLLHAIRRALQRALKTHGSVSMPIRLQEAIDAAEAAEVRTRLTLCRQLLSEIEHLATDRIQPGEEI